MTVPEVQGWTVMVLHDQDFLNRAAAAKARVPQLPPEALTEQLGSARLIDVREPEEVAAGSLPDAVNIPLDALAQRISTAVPDRSTPIVCFCAGGNRGSLAAAELLDLGYTHVSSIAGGLRALDALNAPATEADGES
jgi:phage shock protein E